MKDDLDAILDPDSIAVVGASTTDGKRGHRTVVDLLEGDFEGPVYPINPKHDEVCGLTAYPSVTDVPAAVDLAFVVIPAEYVPDAIRDCGEAGIEGAVVPSAGFSEVGNDDLESDLLAAAVEHGVRIVGPNVQGIFNGATGLDLLDYQFETPAGNVALATQSGNIGLDLSVDALDHADTGFSLIVGVGNEADLGYPDYVRYFGTHPETDVIALYVEGMADGREFLREARQAVEDVPIVAYKSGETSAGKSSARSHTAAIAGDIDVIDAAYRQAGVCRVDELDLVVPVADALANLPAPESGNVGVITDGGGHGTAAVDALAEAGLSAPELASETKAEIRDLLPASPNVSNPVDVMGYSDQRTMWYECARCMLADPNVDQLLYTGAVGGYDEYWYEEVPDEHELGAAIASLVDEFDAPVVVHSMFEEIGSESLSRFEAEGVFVLESIADAVTCLRALTEYGDHCRNADRKSDFVLADGASDRERRTVVDAALADGRDVLPEYDARRAIREYGIPTPDFELATTQAEAVTAAAEFERPVAMKIVSPDVVHRSDAGGVALDVSGDADVRQAYDRLVANVQTARPDASIAGVLLSPMVDEGLEFIVGTATDPEVGPVITFGLGGVFVEALDKSAFRALPITEFDARELIAELDASALLDGPRGAPAVDRDELVELLLSVSDLVADHPSIRELDLNPVVATETGLSVLDASIHLDSS